MITITKKLDLPDTYPLDRIGPLSDLLFLILKPPDFPVIHPICISLAAPIFRTAAGI